MDENEVTSSGSDDFSDIPEQGAQDESSEEVTVSDLETLVLAEVPDAYESLTPLLTGAGVFFGGGLLLAILAWVIGYALHSSFRILDMSSK